MAITEESKSKTKETGKEQKYTPDAILQDVIDQINELENRLKKAKSLVDLFILYRDMKLELTAISLQLNVFRSILQYEGVLPGDFTLEDLRS